jgi:hypothetical protein
MSEFLISSAFLFAYRQSAGETPAIRWSRLHFRIAGASGSQTFRLCSFRIAGETLAIRWSVIRFKNDSQITQIRKIFLGTSET